MEFGSDFHAINFKEGRALDQFLPEANHYGLGRHSLIEIIRNNEFKTLWIPSYYCRESIKCLKDLNIQIRFYESYPLENPSKSIRKISYGKEDAVLIINYFGLWGNNDTPSVSCTIIEDHSHDLLSHWALNSKADWCFASIRKSIPVAEGGVLWSPKGKTLPLLPNENIAHSINVSKRHLAMQLKKKYLYDGETNKKKFLELFRQTEENLDMLDVSPLNSSDVTFLKDFAICDWYNEKKKNWKILVNTINDNHIFDIVAKADDWDKGKTPFSLILLFANSELRDHYRKNLIENDIYPAILWSLSSDTNYEASEFSARMLSIHCDARYQKKDMIVLGNKINEIVSNLK